MIYKIHLFTDEVPVQFFMSRAGHFVFGGTNRSSSDPGASRRTNEPSPTKTPSSEPSSRTSKQPCARGACCDQGHCSAWATTGYARDSCQDSWKTWSRREEEQWAHCEAEDRRVFGITGTGAPPPLSLGLVQQSMRRGFGTVAWVREEEKKTSENRQRRREAEEAHNNKVKVASRVTIASLRCFRAALIGRTQELPKRRRL